MAAYIVKVLTQHRHLFRLLDRCAAEVAELAGLYETAVLAPSIARSGMAAAVALRFPRAKAKY
jgi:hypothetical protein